MVTPTPGGYRRRRGATNYRRRPSRTGRAAVERFWAKQRTPEARAAAERSRQRQLDDQRFREWTTNVVMWAIYGVGGFFVFGVVYAFVSAFVVPLP